MSDVDVLIVKPGGQKAVYEGLSAFRLTAIEPPLWGALLAGYLRNRGYAVDMLDAEVAGWSHTATADRIVDRKPLLVVVLVWGANPSASTMNMGAAREVVRALKERTTDAKVLLHGLHPSALPERTLREEDADFVCEGEGFYTLPGLIDALKAGGSEFRIPGLWFRDGDRICSNPRAPLFNELDELPVPAWDLLSMSDYRAHNWHCFDNINQRQPYGVIYTSLGCPFHCSFCCINAIFGKPGIRYRAPEKVVADIDYLVSNHGVRNIKIIDELFALNEERVVEICDLITERHYDLNMWAYARVNTVTPRMLERMKKAGINWVGYGFESGSKRVLNSVEKSYDLSAAGDVVKMTYDAGLYIGANFIFGLPEDDFDSMQDTLSMAMDMNAEWTNFYATMAYPGSRLYDEAIEKGWQLPESWTGYSPYAYESLSLPTKHLTPGEVTSFRDYAFHAYFENPRYLDKIKRVFGIETVDYIRQMSKHRLKRKYTQP